ncbi:MAG: LysM peptidoglycan-binding domain-containing protein, partial [Flavobacteriales bacterium]
MKFAFFLSKSKAFLLFVLVVFPLALMSQVKGPLEVIDGKKFYVHKVEKGQTLYAISRLYACDINDILSANPGADQGLKEGQTLKVPAPASQKVEEKDPPKADPKTTGEKLHEVQRKETLYAIAKMYDVDINEIIALNPGVDQGLKKGQMLRIPSKEKKVEAPVVT